MMFASIAGHLLQHAADSWPWYVVRASGFIGLIGLVVLMISGIGSVTGLTYRFIEPVRAWALHRAVGIATLAAVGVHMSVLLLEKFVKFSLADVVIPFFSSYKPVELWGLPLGSLGIALGILATYGLAAVVYTSLKYIGHRRKLWRGFHYVSYGVVLFAFIHALMLGYDLTSGPLRIVVLGSAILVGAAVLSRLYRAGTIKRKLTA